MSDKAKLDKLMGELNDGHAKNFDPSRFAFIQSLVQRLNGAGRKNNEILIKRALSGAKQYKATLHKYRHQALKTLATVSAEFPEQIHTAQTQFKQCQYKQLERLHAKLVQHQTYTEQLALLTELSEQINQPLEGDSEHQLSRSLEEILNEQERQTLTAVGCAPPIKVDGSGEQLELQSMKYFRESIKHFNIDKIIARAIDNCPENAGPHNPHMLVIKSLTQLRDVSPDYLRRFASQFEVVLWLEKNAVKLSGVKKVL